MKNFYKTAFTAMAALTLTLTACSDDDSGSTGGGNNPSNGSYISAKVSGTNFETMNIAGHSTGMAQKTGLGDQTFISITATSQNTNTMVITLSGVTGTGTYNLNEDEGNENNVSFVDVASGISYNSTANCEGAEGTLKVTHYDNQKIEGTFQFVGKNDDDCSKSKNVTEGKFRGIFAN